MRSFSHIQQFAFQWKDPKAVSPDDPEASHSQCLGRVSLCQNEGTFLGESSTSIVSIVQLRNTLQLVVLCPGALLVEFLLGLELHPALNGFYNATFGRLVD